MDTLQIFLLIGIGLIVGFYSGVMGTGGNVIFIPILDAMLTARGVHDEELVKSVIAHSLIITLFNGLFVSYRHYRANNFYPKQAIITALPGMVLATITTQLIATSDWYNKTSFNLVFASMLLLLVAKLFTDRKSGVVAATEKSSRALFLITGSITGILTALSGLGGGIVLIPAFTDVMKMSIRKAVSISISVISLLALPISIRYLTVETPPDFPTLRMGFGYISLGIIFPILIGVFIGAPFGVKIAHKVSPLTIRLTFASVILFVCIKTLYNIAVG